MDGAATLVIEIEDNGTGMSADILSMNFWGLGYSNSRADKVKIGEKGHGTKIYLRSEGVHVRTQSITGALEGICERPMRALTINSSRCSTTPSPIGCQALRRLKLPFLYAATARLATTNANGSDAK